MPGNNQGTTAINPNTARQRRIQSLLQQHDQLRIELRQAQQMASLLSTYSSGGTQYHISGQHVPQVGQRRLGNWNSSNDNSGSSISILPHEMMNANMHYSEQSPIGSLGNVSHQSDSLEGSQSGLTLDLSNSFSNGAQSHFSEALLRSVAQQHNRTIRNLPIFASPLTQTSHSGTRGSHAYSSATAAAVALQNSFMQTNSQPRYRSKPVCKLLCRYCSNPVCNRGMKAILLADSGVELFSTDSPPPTVGFVHDDYVTEKCMCRIRDIACLSCGNQVGYHVTQPCKTCLNSCNNGHFWMFHKEHVEHYERTNGNKGVFWAELPGVDKDMELIERKPESMCR